MSTITLPNIRVSSDLTVKVRLKDSGVAIDWSTLTKIKASIYSDAQRALAGRCDVSIDAEDSTLLVCNYAANKPQYVGVNRIVVSAKYMGETKTYDKPAFTFVRWTADQEGEQITIDDPDVDVEISVEDISSSILQEAVDAAFEAADRANDAAAAAEHMVDIHTGPEGKSAYEVAVEEGYTGTEEEWLASLVGPQGAQGIQGETGEAAGFGTVSVSLQEDGGQPSATVAASGTDTAKNFAFTFNNLKGEKGDKGDQGNSGYTGAAGELEVVNNLTDGGAAKALSAEMGKTLEGEVSQLEAKVIAKSVQSPNLFNGHTVPGYITSGGTIATNGGYANYVTTDLIDITGLGNYFRTKNNQVTVAYNFYDNTDTWLGTKTVAASSDTYVDISTLTYYSSIAKMRVCFYAAVLDEQQIEAGKEVTEYHPYGVYYVLDIDKVLDKDIPIGKIDYNFGRITTLENEVEEIKDKDLSTKLNLFDVSQTVNGYISTDGYTILTSGGNANYTSMDYFVPIDTNDYVVKNNSNHFRVYLYDSVKAYLGGYNIANQAKLFKISDVEFVIGITPGASKYFRFSLLDEDVSGQQLQRGDTITKEVSFDSPDNNILNNGKVFDLPTSKIYHLADYIKNIVPEAIQVPNILVVDQNDPTKFQKISDAVNSIADEESATIIVMPGDYEDIVYCPGKTINLIGVNKKLCRLWNSTGDYATPPLHINSGCVKNLTIESLYDSEKDYSSLTRFAYAVHIDINRGFPVEKLHIDNCTLKSQWNNTLGCGATDGEELEISNCIVIADYVAETGVSLKPQCFNTHGGGEGANSKIILRDNVFICTDTTTQFEVVFSINPETISQNMEVLAVRNVAEKVLNNSPQFVHIKRGSWGNQNDALNFSYE